MEEKNITANMARETIARQSNEDEVTAVFRLHIMRFWSRERVEIFCMGMLGISLQEYRAWRQAVEQSGRQDTKGVYCRNCEAVIKFGEMKPYRKDDDTVDMLCSGCDSVLVEGE